VAILPHICAVGFAAGGRILSFRQTFNHQQPESSAQGQINLTPIGNSMFDVGGWLLGVSN
jgi:hypothetical protein